MVLVLVLLSFSINIDIRKTIYISGWLSSTLWLDIYWHRGVFVVSNQWLDGEEDGDTHSIYNTSTD